MDLCVQSGRILALLGPSGCGKTTTLRLIAGFEQLDEGEICIGGRVVSSHAGSQPPEKRRIGMVFQEGALFPHLTVEQNVGYGLRKAANRAGRVAETLELVELSAMKHRMPHELSGGQQQRVAIARALAPQPEILLMDEPFSSLDAKLSEQLRREVVSILRSSGATVIFVTHNQESALQVGDEVALMNEGRVEQIGSPASVFHSPATKYAADFMGAVDFLPIDMDDDGVSSELGPLNLTGTSVEPLMNQDSALVEIMVRPDCLECIPASGSGLVIDREFRGVSYLYRVRLESGREIRSMMSHIAEFAIGSRVTVRLRQGHNARLFVNGRLVDAGSLCN